MKTHVIVLVLDDDADAAYLDDKMYNEFFNADDLGEDATYEFHENVATVEITP